MTVLSFSLHPAAVEEAEKAARWYRERSPRAAARFVKELNRVLDRILEAPRRWPLGVGGTRKIKLPFFPFSIIYLELEGEIRVLAVAHGHREPEYWRYRL